MPDMELIGVQIVVRKSSLTLFSNDNNLRPSRNKLSQSFAARLPPSLCPRS